MKKMFVACIVAGAFAMAIGVIIALPINASIVRILMGVGLCWLSFLLFWAAAKVQP